MTVAIRIEARYNGPPDSANGGYAAGLIAVATGATVNVRLHLPVPLERQLMVEQAADDQWDVRHEGEKIATATQTRVSLDVPQPVSYIEARGVSTHYVGFAQHAYSTCFVCGPKRQPPEGLNIFAGSVPGTSIVAAPWLPRESLADGSGKVGPEFIWAALDCPGYFARRELRPALLGEIAVHIDRCVHIDEPCVVIGWPIRVEGRKHYVGTALFDEDGERCAVGATTWIALDKSAAAETTTATA